jgi:hypothetical protein
MDIGDRDSTSYDVVDDALSTYPLEPAPEKIFPAVMGQIRAQGSVPRFRLFWLDYALSGFLAGMIGLGVYLGQSITVSPHWTARVQVRYILWRQHIHLMFIRFGPEILAFGLMGVMVFALIALAYLRRRRLSF